MIIQFILKGLFFYFLFLFARSFFKGMKGGPEQAINSKNAHQRPKQRAQKQEDVVEADFRRL